MPLLEVPKYFFCSETRADTVEKLKSLFKCLDANGDGVVTLSELNDPLSVRTYFERLSRTFGWQTMIPKPSAATASDLVKRIGGGDRFTLPQLISFVSRLLA